MEESTSNMTIAVMMAYLACHEVEYLAKTGVFNDLIYGVFGRPSYLSI